MKNKLGIFVFTWLFLSSLLVVSIGQQPSIHPISPIHGDFDIIGNIGIRQNNELRFYDNGNYVGFEAPALSADQIWVLPTADGTADQVLRTNGSGTLSWASAAAGSGTFELDDTNASNILTGSWNEDDTSDRNLYFKVNSADRTIDLSANLTLSVAGAALIDDANASAQRTTMGVAIGSDVEAHDASLTSIAGLTYVSGSFIALTAEDTYAVRTYAETLSDIGAAASSHAMSTHSDEDTYNISTSGLATVTKGYVHGAETTQTPSAAFTVDWSAKQVQRVTITGVGLDITFTNPAGPCRLILVIVQGDGDDTIDWTNEADIIFPGGVDPTLSTGSGDIDCVTFYFDGTNYLGLFNGDFR